VANVRPWLVFARLPSCLGLIGVAIGAAAACNAAPFACLEAADCSDGANVGTCESTGWCSFLDPDCASGARYGEHAGDGLSGRCVDAEGTSTTDASTTATTTATTPATITTSDPTSDPVTTATATTTEETTDDTGVPACGNGDLELDELCDDGNVVPGDGCSELCVPSGSVVWDRSIMGEPGAHGHSLDAFGNGDLAVGFTVTLDNGVIPGVRRISDEGDTVWTWAFTDAEWIDAYTWGLDVALVDDAERIAVAVDGLDQTSQRAGIAVLDDQGATEWSRVRGDLILFGAAMQPTGVTIIAGRDLDAGAGAVLEYSQQGTLIATTNGEPYTPEDGFAFDVMLDGDVFYFAGMYGQPGEETAFLGATVDQVMIRHDFAPSTYNEGLAIALDPLSGRRWITGYAQNLGGWIAVVDATGILVDATIVTETFSANLHGIAVDPSGAAIAVGWDSTGGTRDAYAVKVAPDGAKIWTTTFTTPGGDDDLRDVVIAADGSIFVVGTRVDDVGVPSGWVARLVP